MSKKQIVDNLNFWVAADYDWDEIGHCVADWMESRDEDSADRLVAALDAMRARVEKFLEACES